VNLPVCLCELPILESSSFTNDDVGGIGKRWFCQRTDRLLPVNCLDRKSSSSLPGRIFERSSNPSSSFRQSHITIDMHDERKKKSMKTKKVLSGRLIVTHISSFGTQKSQCFLCKGMSPPLSRVNSDLQTIENACFFKQSDAKNVGNDESGRKDLQT